MNDKRKTENVYRKLVYDNLESTEKRLKHLLESDYIAAFDEIDPKTGGYKRDISDVGKILPDFTMKDLIRLDAIVHMLTLQHYYKAAENVHDIRQKLAKYVPERF